ncbi:MAG: HAD hydrolase-like protein [Bryobacteraceae bacterium]|jgi:phosphoglycolate phosphatase
MHPALVLFDIDGTLVRRAGPHHRQALVEAVRRVTGLETSTDQIPVHGMLDPDILTRMMRDVGVTQAAARQAMPEIVRRAQAIYGRGVPDLRRKCCPGVRLLLPRLSKRGVLLGLVTGNLTRIGWKKLERAGLKSYFRFGAFGEMARDRAGLARLAIRQARSRSWIARDTPVSLIGDAPSDIIAAQRNGIRAIAVHTGISTREDLTAYAPDLLLENLRALKIEDLLG